jgi:hypothetical protein
LKASKIKYGFIALSAILWQCISFGQECNIVYVAPGGATSGTAGTKANPADIFYGITLSSSTNNKIYIAAGTYNISAPINLKSNVTLEGGFDLLTWKKSNSTTTTIYRDNSNPEPNPSRIVAMYGNNISNFRLQDLTIRSASVFSGGISSYALHLNGCSDYEIVRCKIIAGNAANGGIGTSGTNGLSGTNGTKGEDGDKDGPCCTAGGIGASGSYPGSYGGGNGGNGGEQGTADCTVCGKPSHATNGYPGTSGQVVGGGGGLGGNGGSKIVTCIYPASPPRTSVNDGKPGLDGTPGLPGTPGNNGTASFTGGFYVPANGTAGGQGTNGHGGGGGGGGGSLGGIPYDCFFGLPPNVNGSGAGGGGGGEGGQAGLGGSGGIGGGGSFGIYLNNNDISETQKLLPVVQVSEVEVEQEEPVEREDLAVWVAGKQIHIPEPVEMVVRVAMEVVEVKEVKVLTEKVMLFMKAVWEQQ